MDWAYPAAVVTELKGSPNGGTDYKSLILRTGRPQEATFVHWDGMASRHPVPSRIF